MNHAHCPKCQGELPAGLGTCPHCAPARVGDTRLDVRLTVETLSGEAVGAQFDGGVNAQNVSVTPVLDVGKVEAGGRAVGTEIRIDKFLGTFVVDNVGEQSPQLAKDQKLRALLLERVKETWIEGVLVKELRGVEIEVRGHLAKHEARAEDFDKAEAGEPGPDRGEAVLLKKVRDVLLILGEPGAGKTIALLKLARRLIEEAERSPAQPVPVVLNLSSWGARSRTFKGWLIAELNSQYQLPPALWREWIEGYSLTLLLDGLDEVKEEHRERCVEAINEFLKESIGFMAVSCRSRQYEALNTRLKAGGSMILHRLSAQDISDYVGMVGLSPQLFLDTVEKSDALRELAASPLILSIMVRVYGDAPAGLAGGHDSIEEYQARIFEDYVKSSFDYRQAEKESARRATTPPYTREETVAGLAWLARRLREHATTVFRLEQMQPSWLGQRAQSWVYALVTRMLAAALVAASFCPLFWDAPDVHLYVLTPGIGGGLVCGLLAGLRLRKTDGPPGGAGIGRRILRGVLYGSAVWVASALLAVAAISLSLMPEQTDPAGEDLRWRVGAFALAGLGLGYVFFAAILGALFGYREGSGTSSGDILVKTVGWSWKLLAVGLLVGAFASFLFSSVVSLFMWAVAVVQGVKVTASDALTFGFFIGIFLSQLLIPLATVIAGLRGSNLDKNLGVNRGVWRAGRHGLVIGLAMSLVSGLLFYLLQFMVGPEQGILEQVFGAGIFFTPIISVSVGLYVGGLAFIQHFVLRLLLYRGGHVPWDYAAFLDYAAELTLLRKVGGGYIFRHNSLRDFLSEKEWRAADAKVTSA